MKQKGNGGVSFEALRGSVALPLNRFAGVWVSRASGAERRAVRNSADPEHAEADYLGERGLTPRRSHGPIPQRRRWTVQCATSKGTTDNTA